MNSRYENYLERLRIGTEYRVSGNVALRGGMADKHLTVGLGLRYKFLEIDAAYAYESFVGKNAIFAQLMFGW